MNTTILTPAPQGGGFAPGYIPEVTVPLRRPHGERSKRLHAAVALVSASVMLITLAILAIHGYIAWTLAHPYVAPLASNPKLAVNLDYHDVTFPSASGKTMVNGWYIPSEVDSERTVVFSHGYGANREESWVPMYDLANLLHGLRYNVVMFDYGYASSVKRTPATGGVEESQQLLAAIDYAKRQGAEEIVVWGFSMGAGTALQTALLTDDIHAMILDSMFITDGETLQHNLDQLGLTKLTPSLPLIEGMLPMWTGTRVSDIPSAEVRSTSYDMPIYMIHGTEDAKAPVRIAEQVTANQHHPLSQSWIVKGGKHELLFKVHPKEYMQRAALFLSQVHAS